MGNRNSRSINIKDSAWKRTGISFTDDEHCSEAIAISPSTQFAMIRAITFKEGLKNKIFVFDLFKNEVNRVLLEPEWKKPAYCYWLNEETISIFDVNEEEKKYVHYFYQCKLHDPKWKLQLLTKSEYPFQINVVRLDLVVDVHNSVRKITINNHDFLFVKSYEFVLVPYNLLEYGPSLPLLKMSMAVPVYWSRINGQYSTVAQYAFAFRDKVYFSLDKGDSDIYDRFLQVDLNDFDLISREVNYTLDTNNATIFFPQQLNKGSYTGAGNGVGMSQDGPLVLFYENTPDELPTTKDKRKIWLLNLENGTIVEKMIENQAFTEVTLYRGFLILWNSKQSTMKYHWLKNEVPTLEDICHVTLLDRQQQTAELSELNRRLWRF